jgi:hypothetical protein
MASVFPTITALDIHTETIVGNRRHSRSISLPVSTDVVSAFQDCRLLVTVNRRLDMDRSRYGRIQRCEHEGNVFEFCLPQWMDAQADPRHWRSQSRSSALYLSRTDLLPCFGISGVILLQILLARSEAPCFTSRHKHLRTREVFNPLNAGPAEIRRGDNRWQKLDSRFEIPPGEIHQLRNLWAGPSIVLIQMYGDCRIDNGANGPRLDMSDHIYQPD